MGVSDGYALLSVRFLELKGELEAKGRRKSARGKRPVEYGLKRERKPWGPWPEVPRPAGSCGRCGVVRPASEGDIAKGDAEHLYPYEGSPTGLLWGGPRF